MKSQTSRKQNDLEALIIIDGASLVRPQEITTDCSVQTFHPVSLSLLKERANQSSSVGKE